jgi:hypothetical protein
MVKIVTQAIKHYIITALIIFTLALIFISHVHPIIALIITAGQLVIGGAVFTTYYSLRNPHLPILLRKN